MPITERMMEQRRSRIGSSDAYVLLGVPGPGKRNLVDLWMEKAGKTHPDDYDNAAMDVGRRCEPAVLDFAESKLGLITRNQFRVRNDLQACASCDAVLRSDNTTPVEAKTAGMSGPLPGYWQPQPGIYAVPDHVAVQVQHQMLVTGAKKAYVAAWVKDKHIEEQIFEIPRNADLQKILAERILKFWEAVRKNKPPEGFPSLNTIKLMKREDLKEVEIRQTEVDEWMEATLSAKAAEGVLDQAKQKLLAALGDGEVGVTETGRLYYVEENAGRRLDLKRLAAADPELFARVDRYRKASTRRVPRWKGSE